MSKVRDYFPGNNTTEGFYSYYQYILSQEEANRIICIKGGPGTGKSTFMRTIGKKLVSNDENVDFLHCSADENSLDGLIIKDKNIAFVDGTCPHVIDPITPGAVDEIINLANFLDEDNLKKYKDKIIKHNKESLHWYSIAYNYLAAARSIENSLSQLINNAVEESDIYKITKVILKKEMGEYDISLKAGTVKKFFASAITPSGSVNYLKSIFTNVDKVYFINSPLGYENLYFMNLIKNHAIGRGFDIECFYCPMNPSNKIEHIVIPQLNLGFVTGNKWHDIEPWEIYENEDDEHQIVMIDIEDFTNQYYLETYGGLRSVLSKELNSLIYSAVLSLSRAKENHDIVEKIYISNMDFDKVDKLRDEYIARYL